MAKKTVRAGFYIYRGSTTDQNLNGQISELQTYAESEPVNAAYRVAWARPGRPVVPQSHFPGDIHHQDGQSYLSQGVREGRA